MKRLLAGLLLLPLLLSSLPSAAIAQVAVQANGVAGESGSASDGQPSPLRQDKSKALVVSQAHGRFTEAARKGHVFHLPKSAYTIVSTNASAGAMGTILLINGFWNPVNSGVAAAILWVDVDSTSGTPGGPLIWNYYCGLNVTSAATGTIYSGVLNNNAGASAMVPQAAVALVTTPASTGAMLSNGPAGGPSAGGALSSGIPNRKFIEGGLIVPPGCVAGLASTATGTTHIVSTDIGWEEIPYP